LSIALSIREPNVNSHAPKEAIDRFVELIGKVFNDVGWFFAMEQLEEEDKTKHDLRYSELRDQTSNQAILSCVHFSSRSF